ncbi:Hypothetical protein, putative [Bodo saltans]|uniref:Uncharacterized protein n=1 Tax=Bodo saltans TaxID=75058 RepID=A0A0S4JQX5_BODSA|nr:Hypothetical protein, putative [Bodo saltans]|eukprot:CUG90919.1 Hypothetical protein, putative [Bodo saltans]
MQRRSFKDQHTAMNYCNVCNCNVSRSNCQEHIDGKRHLENSEVLSDDDYQDDIEYCDDCDCVVPANNWQAHIRGRSHIVNRSYLFRNYDSDGNDKISDDDDLYSDDSGDAYLSDDENSDDDLVSDDFGEDEHETYKVVSLKCISYTQNSIRHAFKDETALGQGIRNLQKEIPRNYRTNRIWDAKFVPQHMVRVFYMGGGHYAVHNNRTLYCYQQAGFLWIPVNVISPSYEYRCFETPPIVRRKASFYRRTA